MGQDDDFRYGWDKNASRARHSTIMRQAIKKSETLTALENQNALQRSQTSRPANKTFKQVQLQTSIVRSNGSTKDLLEMPVVHRKNLQSNKPFSILSPASEHASETNDQNQSNHTSLKQLSQKSENGQKSASKEP